MLLTSAKRSTMDLWAIDPSIDRTAPELDNAVVNANGQVILTFNEALDAGNPPVASDFTVKINGIDRIPDSVQINGKDVSLSFIPPIYQGQTVDVRYKYKTANVDDSKELQDTTGNDVKPTSAKRSITVGSLRSIHRLIAPHQNSITQW